MTAPANISSLDEAPLPPALEHRIDLIAALGIRRDKILNAETFDLAAAKALVADYEAAGFVACAADLRRRVEHYQQVLEAENGK